MQMFVVFFVVILGLLSPAKCDTIVAIATCRNLVNNNTIYNINIPANITTPNCLTFSKSISNIVVDCNGSSMSFPSNIFANFIEMRISTLGQNITIQNCQFFSGSIYVDGTANLIIQNNTFYSNISSPSTAPFIKAAGNNTLVSIIQNSFLNCYIFNNGGGGVEMVQLTRCENCTVSNNVIINTTVVPVGNIAQFAGLYAVNSDYVEISHNIVQNTQIVNGTARGIYVDTCVQSRVFDNTVSEFYTTSSTASTVVYAIKVCTSPGSIYQNTIEKMAGTTVTGVYVELCDDPVYCYSIYDNSIANLAGTDVTGIEATTNATYVYLNTITYLNGSASAHGAVDGHIVGNTFANFSSPSSIGAQTTPATGTHYILNNIFEDSTAAIFFGINDNVFYNQGADNKTNLVYVFNNQHRSYTDFCNQDTYFCCVNFHAVNSTCYPVDAKYTCGNNICDAQESYSSCAADCPLATLPPPMNPTPSPTSSPTPSPTSSPSIGPLPSYGPTNTPTSSPTNTPTSPPTDIPTSSPTDTPTSLPSTSEPTSSPTILPSPTVGPTSSPTDTPTSLPTYSPTPLPLQEGRCSDLSRPCDGYTACVDNVTSYSSSDSADTGNYYSCVGCIAGFVPSSTGACIAACGNGVCDSSSELQENCVNCPEDCAAPCSMCGDGFCGSDESCSTCSVDCGSCHTDNCASLCKNGNCNEEGICVCSSGYSGPFCVQEYQIPSVVVNSNETGDPQIIISPDSSSHNTTFFVGILRIDEISPNGEVVQSQIIPKNLQFVLVNSAKRDTLYDEYVAIYKINQAVGGNIKIFVRIYHDQGGSVNFANETLNIPPYTIKMTTTVNRWPFQSVQNSLSFIFSSTSSSASSSELSSCAQVQQQYYGNIDNAGNLYSVLLKQGNYTLWVQLLNFALVDSKKRPTRMSWLGSGEISMTLQHFWDSATIDPNYQILTNTNDDNDDGSVPLKGGSGSDDSGDKCSSRSPPSEVGQASLQNWLSPKIMMILIIGVVGLAILVGAIMVAVLIARKKALLTRKGKLPTEVSQVISRSGGITRPPHYGPVPVNSPKDSRDNDVVFV